MEEGVKTSARKLDKRMVVAVVVAVFLTAAVSAVGAYFWQKASVEKAQQEIRTEVITTPTAAVGDEMMSTKNETKGVDKACGLDLPVVVYGRAGLLNNTAEGRAEKERLEERLVNPYTFYQSEEGRTLLTFYVTVPVNVGEAYTADAIFADGVTEGFLFGTREGEYDYWRPECMGPCPFSDAFRERYPQIVRE